MKHNHAKNVDNDLFIIPPYLQKFKLPQNNLDKRRLCIGGSEINILASGDNNKQLNLYNVKCGKSAPDDLSTVWAVHMGWATEDLNLSWVEYKNQIEIINKQLVIESKKHPIMRCTLDGSIKNWKNRQAVIDAKFTMGFKRNDEEYADVIPRLVKYYTPQLHWNAYLLEEHTGKPVSYGLLTIIRGGSEPTLHEVKINKDYQEYLILIARDFMQAVEEGYPYVIPELYEPPVPEDHKVAVDMTSTKHSLDWKNNAEKWVQSYGAKQTFMEAEKNLKDLIPRNASEGFGNGIKVKVFKNGRKKVEVYNDS